MSLDDSWSSVWSTRWVPNVQLPTKTEKAAPAILSPDRERLSCTHPRPVTDFHPDPHCTFSRNKGETTASSTTRLTSQFNDCSAFVFKHLLPSAERVALDRSFYTKMDLRALEVKVTNQQGPAEKGCVSLLCSPGWVWAGGVWSSSAVSWICSLPTAVVGEKKKPALRCKVPRFIMVSLTWINDNIR